jgi:hypothetical protein
MAIAPMSADQSAAAWAGEAAAAAEAYVDSQAEAAAAARDAQEKWERELAALAALAASQNDGVDPPPPPPPAGVSFGQDGGSQSGGSSAGGSGGSATTPSGSLGGGNGLLIPDGNGGYIHIPHNTANVSVTQQAPATPPAWDYNQPIGNAGGNSSPVQTPANTPPPPDPQGAPSGANQVNQPDEPEKPKEAPKIVSGFGEQVDKLLNASPSLREDWQKMLAAGWEVKLLATGKSKSDNGDKKLWINPADARNDPRLLAVLLSHEVGHAVNEAPYKLDAKKHSKDDYVERTVEARLEHEGDAAFENARYREEILANTGIDIGIAGRNDDRPYLQIYDDFKTGKLTESEAKWLMGQLMGEELEARPSTTKRESYAAEAAADYEKERSAH